MKHNVVLDSGPIDVCGRICLISIFSMSLNITANILTASCFLFIRSEVQCFFSRSIVPPTQIEYDASYDWGALIRSHALLLSKWPRCNFHRLFKIAEDLIKEEMQEQETSTSNLPNFSATSNVGWQHGRMGADNADITQSQTANHHQPLSHVTIGLVECRK